MLCRTKMISALALAATLWMGSTLAVTTVAPTGGEIALNLQARLAAAALRVEKITLLAPDLVRQFYLQRAHQPAWFDHDGAPSAAAAALLDAIASAPQQGLNTADYHYAHLQQALLAVGTTRALPAQQLAELELVLTDAFLGYGSHLLNGRLNPQRLNRAWTLPARSANLPALLEQALTTGGAVQAALASLNPPHAGFRSLQAALAQYRTLARTGEWPLVSAGGKLEQGMSTPRVRELRARLQASGDLAPAPAAPAEQASDELFDAAVHAAVMHFQQRHGLEPDGVVGPRTFVALNTPLSERIRQLEINLERWRWLPDDLGARHILVNIPEFEMRLVEDGQTLLRSKVVVGREQRQTPIFSASMTHLVIRPYWHVPMNIAVADKLPLLRKNPYALKRQNFRIYNAAGREIDPGSVNWHSVGRRNFSYQMRQDPGPRNALGTVKFMFPNQHNVYLHDTSAPELFARNRRAYSSGCVRIAEPIELATLLLQNDPTWDRQAILDATAQKSQSTVQLAEAIPVHLLYWTVWQDDAGVLHFGEDIYRRDAPLDQALLALANTPGA